MSELTERFGELLAGGPDAFPLDEAMALIAAQIHPSVDPNRLLARLDVLAETCSSPDLAGLLEHLFGAGKFAGNTSDYYDPRNSLLDHVLDRRLGIPISLSIVALEVGRRLDIPLGGVGMPGHFLIRHRSEADVFADPFGGPAVIDAAACRSIYERLGARGRWDNKHLVIVSKRSIVVRTLTNLKVIYQQRSDLAGLRQVMALRATIPSLGEGERKEFRRLMAGLN